MFKHLFPISAIVCLSVPSLAFADVGSWEGDTAKPSVPAASDLPEGISITSNNSYTGFAKISELESVYIGTAYRTFDSQLNTEIDFSGSTRLDNGITFTLEVRVDEDSPSSAGAKDAGASEESLDFLEPDDLSLNSAYTLEPGVRLRGGVFYSDYEDEAAARNHAITDLEGHFVVVGMKLSF